MTDEHFNIGPQRMITLTKRDGRTSLLPRPWKCPSRCYTRTCCPGCRPLPAFGYWSQARYRLWPKSSMAEAEMEEERHWPCCPQLREQKWTQDKLKNAIRRKKKTLLNKHDEITSRTKLWKNRSVLWSQCVNITCRMI